MSEPDHVIDVAAPMGVADVVAAAKGARLEVSKTVCDRLDEQRAALIQSLTSNPGRIYGFNTGFGDNRTRPTVPFEELGVIQDNLIKSHAAGAGPNIQPEVVRAALAIRAHSLTLGHSGVRGVLVKALCQLSTEVLPEIPAFGSVGASGDLAPLSHLVLPLVEDPDRFGLTYRLEAEFPGASVTRSALGPKEGLALNNGTAFMAAHLSLALDEFENLLWHADLSAALCIEALCGVIDAFESELQALRPHHGVTFSAQNINGHLMGSSLTWSRGAASSDQAQQARDVQGVPDNIQDDYCLRCAPVVHGTAWDALQTAKTTVETELNSVTDNPVVVNGVVLSGPHFHGMPLSFAADQLRTAMAIVGGISERRIAKLMNDKRNYCLPRHLVMDDVHGVKSGWMIAQYTAASMANELKTRSMPYCVGNVTTGNESEDFVSMGANACRAAYECVTVLRSLVAIELAAASRALWIRTRADKGLLSPSARTVLRVLKSEGVSFDHVEDRPLQPLIEATGLLIKNGAVHKALKS